MIAIAEIVADPVIQIRRSNREEAIARYQECWDQLPPVTLFRLTEPWGRNARTGEPHPTGTLLLADGFNRLGAGLRRGEAAIKADVREGTGEEAMEYAVIANTRWGEPLTQDEVADGIKRLHQLHPVWEQQQIAEAMSQSPQTVGRVLRAQTVRRRVLSKVLDRMPDRVLAEIAGGPEEAWKPLALAADRRRWTVEAVRTAVRNLGDDEIEPDFKASLLRGELDPVTRSTDGTLVTPTAFATNGKLARPAVRYPDPVGDDVAERMDVVRVVIEITCSLPSDKPPRHRGLKQYPREKQVHRRLVTVNVGEDHTETVAGNQIGVMDQTRGGNWALAQKVARDLGRTLGAEGWPRQESVVARRP